jgi:hypothetical protein
MMKGKVDENRTFLSPNNLRVVESERIKVEGKRPIFEEIMNMQGYGLMIISERGKDIGFD